MEERLKSYLKNWTLVRTVQLVIGGGVVASGIAENEAAYLVLGGILLAQSLFNISLCGAAGCKSSSTNFIKKVDVKDYKH